MAILTAGFNPAGATNGATIATTDTGDLTAWNAVNGSPIYDNTHTLFGKALAAKCVQSGAVANLKWTTPYVGTTTDCGRLYVYMSARPSGVSLTLLIGATGSANDPRIYVNTNGTISITNHFTAQATSTTALSAGQWYRIEWRFVYATGTGTISCSIYSSPDSTSATETISASSQNFTNPGELEIGSNNLVTWTLWLAQVVACGTAAIGPYPVNTVAPTVSGSGTVGSTLTCGTGTWNGTFTLSYQWTRAGVNISGATSSTYTTVSGDIGNAIGCKVTATGVQATNESATQASGNTITVTSSAVFVPQIVVFT